MWWKIQNTSSVFHPRLSSLPNSNWRKNFQKKFLHLWWYIEEMFQLRNRWNETENLATSRPEMTKCVKYFQMSFKQTESDFWRFFLTSGPIVSKVNLFLVFTWGTWNFFITRNVLNIHSSYFWDLISFLLYSWSWRFFNYHLFFQSHRNYKYLIFHLLCQRFFQVLRKFRRTSSEWGGDFYSHVFCNCWPLSIISMQNKQHDFPSNSFYLDWLGGFLFT